MLSDKLISSMFKKQKLIIDEQSSTIASQADVIEQLKKDRDVHNNKISKLELDVQDLKP